MISLAACTTAKPTPPAVKTMPGIDHVWKIVGHLLIEGATIDETDAQAWNGRVIEVTRASYHSPFQGTCETSGRTRRSRQLDDVVLQLDAPRSIITDYELGAEVAEYKLTCRETQRPPLVMWVSGERAMTCYSGVCYFLRR